MRKQGLVITPSVSPAFCKLGGARKLEAHRFERNCGCCSVLSLAVPLRLGWSLNLVLHVFVSPLPSLLNDLLSRLSRFCFPAPRPHSAAAFTLFLEVCQPASRVALLLNAKLAGVKPGG